MWRWGEITKALFADCSRSAWRSACILSVLTSAPKATYWNPFHSLCLRSFVWLWEQALPACRTGQKHRKFHAPETMLKQWWRVGGKNTPAPCVVGGIIPKLFYLWVSQSFPVTCNSHCSINAVIVFPSPSYFPSPLPVLSGIASQINFLHPNLRGCCWEKPNKDIN